MLNNAHLMCPATNVTIEEGYKSLINNSYIRLFLLIFCVRFFLTFLLKLVESSFKAPRILSDEPTECTPPAPELSKVYIPPIFLRIRSNSYPSGGKIRNKFKPAREYTIEDLQAIPVDSGSQENVSEYRLGGYKPIYVGEQLGDYTVIRKLGYGHFSTVWLCTDTKDKNEHVAIKVVKSTITCENMASEEINLLRKLRNIGPEHPGRKFIIKLIDYFNVNSINGKHTCIAFELMGPSLLHLITQSGYRGIYEPAVKSIIKQVLLGLNYLHNAGVIHTDLKPENILIKVSPEYIQNMIDKVNRYQELGIPLPKTYVTAQSYGDTHIHSKDYVPPAPDDFLTLNRSCSFPQLTDVASDIDASRRINSKKELYVSPKIEIKIADMGNACWRTEKIEGTIQTKQYRALEVLLGSDYDTPVDIWSVGCIAFELSTGEFLFNPKHNSQFTSGEDHILLIYELLEGIPPYIASRGRKAQRYFDSEGELLNISKQHLHIWKTEDVLVQKYEWKRVQAILFASFLDAMIEPDPELRLTAEAALSHQWLEETWS